VHESGPRLRCRPATAAAGFWLDAPPRATEAAGEFLVGRLFGGSDPESAWTCLCGGDYAALVCRPSAPRARLSCRSQPGLGGALWVGGAVHADALGETHRTWATRSAVGSQMASKHAVTMEPLEPSFPRVQRQLGDPASARWNSGPAPPTGRPGPGVATFRLRGRLAFSSKHLASSPHNYISQRTAVG